MIDDVQINQEQINAFDARRLPCQGITLAELRRRLRNELSGYGENTLISDDPLNDVERQFINDGIGVLWPHDWQAVMYSVPAIATPNRTRMQRYFLPDEAEHVMSVFNGDIDINNNNTSLTKMPPHDGWLYDKSFIDASTSNMLSGQPWIDTPRKAITIKDGSCGRYIVVRYARKWQSLHDEDECIDPSPVRINAIIFYACAQYFLSQMQVNTESIRLRNYQQVATNFLQLHQTVLVKDSKPLYIV